MSRIGNKQIALDPKVKVIRNDNLITVEGPEGKLVLTLPEGLNVQIAADQVTVEMGDSTPAMHGMFRTLLSNAITGTVKKWTKTLELVGVGYRAQTTGPELVLNLGFSHPVNIKARDGISFQVVENKIMVLGVNRYLVGEVAATIRRLKPPEPYKGKGIRYSGEHIRKKLGKAAKAVGSPGAK